MEKRKVKILLYTDTNKIGGAENHMLNLAKFLDKNQFWVGVACAKDTGLDNWCEKLKDAGISVFRLNVKHKHDLRHYFELKKLIQKERIDILHNHVWNPASCRYGFMAARREKIPHIMTEHDPFQLTPFKDWIKKKLIRKVSAMIAVSDQNRKLLESLYPSLKEKIHTVHNSIDTTWFESQLLSFSRSDREEYKKDIFQTDEDTPVIIAIAELHPRKGLVYLLDAARILAGKRKKFKVVIVGDGEQQKELENFIHNAKLEEYALLLGRRHDIPYLLKSSSIFVLPSLNEAFGLVLLEAMIAELPIIASKSGGVPEIITHGENGLLIEPKNSERIAIAIETLLDKPEMMQTMGQRNHEKVQQKFEMKCMVEKVESIYREILNI